MSGQHRWGNKIIIGAFVLLVAVLVSQVVGAYFMPQTAVLHLGSHRFEARIADTDRSRQQGLSGTMRLPADEAMVFIFDSDGRWPIWMKDMNYSIDIVWLDNSKHVVDFALDVSPDSYPTKTFFPKNEARYVVELKSGTVKAKGIRVGDQAVFSGTSKEL